MCVRSKNRHSEPRSGEESHKIENKFLNVNAKWLLFVCGLFVLMSVMIGFTKAMAAINTPTLNLSVFLPIILKQEPPTPMPTPTPTMTQTPPTPTSTLMPTSTIIPTPTSTQTPTPTNTPTSTTNPSGVQVLPNHFDFVDSIDYLHIVGEVLNNTVDNLTFVKISVNIYNSNGQFIDTDYTYTDLDDLPAGDKTCFEITLQEPAGWSYYQFEPPTYWTDGHPLPNLTVLNDSGSYDSTFGWYDIIGQVRNDQGSRVEYVSPVGTLYNASGKVIGCDFTYVNSTHLDPGQVSSFKLTFTGRDYTDVNSYRLQVDGNPQ